MTLPSTPIKYLTEEQVNALTAAFQGWYDSTKTRKLRRKRGRYWLVYLVLRYTGARIGEVLMIDDRTDINYREGEIKLVTLKQKGRPSRIVPVPKNVTSEIAVYRAEFPEMSGRIFKIDQANFRKVFYKLAKEAGIPRELAHPHTLRHTRAIELLRHGVPVTVVQSLLGHAYLSTTAIYLRISGQEAKEILRDKGLI
ncbi:site-specific integrase [Candidatus Poribacteria bacterium]|nr:MAG: site-specific integrase [Candidatus Poribacteria bacterium]